MKSPFTLICALLICCFQIVKATDVSGVISSNTTWTAAGSPYVVTSYITINHGVTLTVQSGVTVKFNDGQYMLAYGILNASSATFTSNNVSPTPGIWSYIQCGSSAIADSGQVIMNNCQVLYAQQLYVRNGRAALTNTVLQSFLYHGVQIEAPGILNMTGGSINTTASWASSNGGCIVSNSYSHAYLSGVNMQHCYYGIYLQNNAVVDYTSISISNCTWPVYYSASADLTVHGTNSYTGNTNTAVVMYFSNIADTLTLPTVTIPYFFPYGMTVNAGGRLVIGSTNILKFQIGTALDVNGTLISNANVSENIFFTSIRDDNWGGDTNNDGTATAPASSNWYGVRFQDPSIDANCLMRRCKLRYAGYANYGGISMFNASPTIDLCDISFNYYGIFMQYASNPVISNNTIGSSQFTPIAMSFEANPSMPNNTLSFSDNAYDAIGLIGGTLTANAVIIKRNVTSVQNITYLLLDQIIIPAGKSLTINKGIVIKSYSYAHRIIVDGTLTANATADSLITFTSAKDDNYGNPGDSNKDGTITSPAIGDWGGIIFDPGSTGILNYCRVKYATTWNYGFSTCSTTEYLNNGGIAMIDASPTISNCELKDLNYGISCYRASNPIISNNSMINITYTPFCISGSSDPTFTGNTFTNVAWRAIGLLGGNVCQNGTIKTRNVAGYTNITYVLLADMYINSGTYVNVQPGVVIKMNSSNIYVDGGFKTDGTVSQNVVFTSLKDDNYGNPLDTNGDGNATAPAAGNWGTIKFRATSDDAYCNINYALIKYAGYTGEGAVTFENAGGQTNNSTVSNIQYFGLYINGNSTPSINGVVIQNCGRDPIALSLLSNPTFTSITFLSNGSNALRIIEGTLSSNATLAPRSVAGIPNIAYIIDWLTISTNSTLRILPGVVIKFRDDDGCSTSITVYGKLVANGTALNKIYFTSYADDSKGGDSNNNGNSTSPSPGDWGGYCYNAGISFYNTTNDSLTYCEVSYPQHGLYFSNSGGIFSNDLIQLVSAYGMQVIGSSNPVVTSCQFNNIVYSPVRLSMFSTPTFTSCSALNVGRMALTVASETYSQTATIPVRNFAGYTNITYYMEGSCTINSGTTITVPAGIVFKSSGGNGFVVNGRLNILGSSGSNVVFTDYRDDLYGNPADMNQDGSATLPPDGYYGWGGTWIVFNDVSNDSSTVQYARFRYANVGVGLLSASPTINFVWFDKDNYGVDLNGVSQPKIDNSTFLDLLYYPIQLSLVSFPASLTNNTISGTTFKVLKVRDETLTQDVTLAKRSFGGVSNISYLFGSYTVGTGATLTINPGVVCKFLQSGTITVNKGLIAEGGFEADSNIVFTDIRDDFYGGDANSDNAASSPSIGYWQYVGFNDQSLDPLCRLRHCIVRYSYYGIKTTSASPQVTYSTITKNYYGVYAAAASNPIFHYCDFDDNYFWSVDNVDKSFVIDATNCWWGSNLGPIQTNTAGNGTSTQELITTAVNYTPFRTSGATNPAMGDVSLNGMIQAYDASLVLQKAAGLISLTSTQMQVADVSFNGSVTSFDASLILQYVVGLIQNFPAELLKSTTGVLTDPVLVVGSGTVMSGQDIDINVRATNCTGMLSSDIQLKYDPQYLNVKDLTILVPDMNISWRNDNDAGILYIAMAGANPLNTDTTLFSITFGTALTSGHLIITPVTVEQFMANESDLTANAIPGNITITDGSTGMQGAPLMNGLVFPVYPNPSKGNSILAFQLTRDQVPVSIEVYDMLGHNLFTLVKETLDHGDYSILISRNGTPLVSGSYLIRILMDGKSTTQLLQVIN